MILYNINMQFRRRLLEKIEKALKTSDILVITGMRRVGKTTLLRILSKSIKTKNQIFLDIENPIEQKTFEEKDFRNIWENFKRLGLSEKSRAWVFLDEIQAFPDCVKPLKFLHDHYDVKFVVTGSSSFYLKNLFSESLAGRKILFELFPLNYQEFLLFKGVKKTLPATFAEKETQKNEITWEREKSLFEEYLQFGGFPQVVLAEDLFLKKEYLKDIFKSYYEKDVQVMAGFRNLTAFRDLLLLLVQRIGSKVDTSKLASELGVARDTISSYLSFLEATYVVFFLTAFSNNPDREVSGAKKIYLCDPGLARFLGNTSEGNIFENAVFLQLPKDEKVAFYQKRNGGEIDFLLPHQKIALEVKQTANVRDLQKLSAMAKNLGMCEQYIITRQYSAERGFIPSTEL